MMHPAVQQFVERMGLVMEADGMARSSGRIFGYLLVSGSAVALDEMAEQLRISKASASTNARQLEQCGFLERASAPGDRRDYYRIRADVWEHVLRVAQRRWGVMRRLLGDAAGALPGEMEVGRSRLLEAERFHALVIEESDGLIERWHARQGELWAPPPERVGEAALEER